MAPGSKANPGRLRAERWVVRPGRKNGGAVVVFELPRAALLRVTVRRVFPSCKVMGSFRVRARAGVNRLRFSGRLRGRPLPPGTYRLLLRVRGARADAAAVTIVVVRGKSSTSRLRKARRAAVCGGAATAASESSTSIDPPAGRSNEGGGSSVKTRISVPVANAANALTDGAKALGTRFKRSLEDEGPQSPLFLLVVGLLTLAVAALGAFVLLRIVRYADLRDRYYR